MKIITTEEIKINKEIKPNSIIHGDCLEIMPYIQDKSINMILCDLPYGTTACKWDTPIPLEPLWEQYKRIIKDNGGIVLTASQPFASALVMSNPEMFKYEWVWNKNTSTCFVHAKHRPLGSHENILIFGKGRIVYNPQMIQGKPYFRGVVDNSKIQTCPTKVGKTVVDENKTGMRYPKTVLNIDGNNRIKHVHPTQKPVSLFEYLIKTYTNEGDLVLDNCLGSGTTCIAALNTNRNFIGIEKEFNYCEIGLQRIIERKNNYNNLQ